MKPGRSLILPPPKFRPTGERERGFGLVDVISAREYEELRAGGKHAEAIKNAAKTELPISDDARRLNRARAR